MSDQSNVGSNQGEKTMHCECGNETYHIKWTPDELWAVCAECGRPTSAVGEGWQKQQEWRHQRTSDST